MPSLTVHHPAAFREEVCAKIRKVFTSSNDEIDEKNTKIVMNMEKGIYNYAIREATQAKVVKKWENPIFVQLYVDRLRAILKNLQHAELVTQVRSGEIEPQAVAFMTHQEFRPDRWKTLIDQKMKRDAAKFSGDLVEASTDMYTCKKCKSKRCTYYEMQTRSADEPATVFITCLDCGKRWRN